MSTNVIVWLYRRLGRLLDRGWGGVRTLKDLDDAAIGREWERVEQYAADDDLLISEYRTRLEQRVARYTLAAHEAFKAQKEPGFRLTHSPAVDTIFMVAHYELNGLCIALRLLGGYHEVTFDAEWARQTLQDSDARETRYPQPPFTKLSDWTT